MRAMIRVVAAAAMLLTAVAVQAADKYKPFVLAYKTGGAIETVVDEVSKKLTDAGFEIVGTYSPYETASIIIVTNDELKAHAAASEFGGYGAAQRVAVTRVGNELQVSYTNPVYMSHAYRMAEDMQPMAATLAATLGNQGEFGPDKALNAKKLRKYQYMFGMEYFSNPLELAEHQSYEEAVAAVEAQLAEGVAGVSKVYRIDIPGKSETVFGVALKAPSDDQKHQDDTFIMKEIDFKPLRSSAHLPYEMLVSGNKVYALHARFRIAINFPDLSMMGSNSFMNIMESPGAIARALKHVASGNQE